MTEQVKELYDTLMCNYDFPAMFAEGLAEFLVDEGYGQQIKGKWIFKKYVGEDYYKCSCCGQEYPFPPNWCEYDIHEYLKYCSSCGARMTEDVKDD